jgi:predicted nucleotidyltransferase
MLNLSQTCLVLIQQLAERVLQTPCEIWAYGSRVRGDSHVGSDLDMVIRTHDLSPLPAVELQAFKEACRESNIPILVDIMDWGRIPVAFHAQIMQAHEIIWRSNDGDI